MFKPRLQRFFKTLQKPSSQKQNMAIESTSDKKGSPIRPGDRVYILRDDLQQATVSRTLKLITDTNLRIIGQRNLRH
jgi:hypothetical protein